MIIVHPAAKAGPALRVIMAAQTPIGCLITTMRLSRVGAGMVSP
jgi:hypothetical protein